MQGRWTPLPDDDDFYDDDGCPHDDEHCPDNNCCAYHYDPDAGELNDNEWAAHVGHAVDLICARAEHDVRVDDKFTAFVQQYDNDRRVDQLVRAFVIDLARSWADDYCSDEYAPIADAARALVAAVDLGPSGDSVAP